MNHLGQLVKPKAPTLGRSGLGYAPRMRTSRVAIRGLLPVAVLGAGLALPISCDDDERASRPTTQPPAAEQLTCVDPGEPCVTVFGYPLGGEQSVELRGDFAPDGWEVGIPLTIDGGQWHASVTLPNGSVIQYKFVIDGEDFVVDPDNPVTTDDGLGGLNSVVEVTCGLGSCGGSDGGTTETPDPPPGVFDWRSAVLYFVFVDRFRNGNPGNDAPVDGVETQANYQGGDYDGLFQTIENGYFEDLGVNALWLTVPMDNPDAAGLGTDGHLYSAYHGYWPTDLEAVEEHFGDMALLKKVVNAAHDRGIKVLIDYAMNHVHEDSPLFADHPDWFWPVDFDGKYCVCGQGCAWDGLEGRRCWFTDYLPDWNFQNPDARKASIDNALFWVDELGLDGFRLDAVKHIETIWIEELRARIDAEVEPESGQQFYMVGETFETGNRDAIRQYVSPTLLDGQFDFPLRGAIVESILRRSGTMHDLDGFLSTNDDFYPGLMSTFIGNHDIARVIQTALDEPWGAWDNGGDANWNAPPPLPQSRAPFERVALGFTFIMTTQGVPLIYYGDEIGLPGAGDPDNRRMMQWDGYSTDQEFLLEYIQKLGQIRQAHPPLWKGKRTTVFVSDDVLAYRMTSGEDSIFVAINRADTEQTAEGLPDAATDLLTDTAFAGPMAVLPPRSAVVLLPDAP